MLHGNGCFTTEPVGTGEVVATARVLLFPAEETRLLRRTRIKSYLFFVREDPADADNFSSALAMGPMSFCNHSSDPNCDFAIDEARAEIALTARRRLQANEEITIDYGDYADEIVHGGDAA
jgi:SET domain-containing protein